MSRAQQKYWAGFPPEKCDLCKQPITTSFVDGRAVGGHWAFMCPPCHATKGAGLGVGRGQHYQQQPDGRWMKQPDTVRPQEVKA